MRRLVLLIAAFPFIATLAPTALHAPPAVPRDALFVGEAVVLDETDESRRRLGPLRFVAGWSMRSNDPRFGGISAIHVEKGDATAISDAGWLIRFRIGARGPYELHIQPLDQGPGDAWRKRDRDVESLAIHDGVAWLGFERQNAIWRYDRATWRPTGRVAPPAIDDWPNNAGPESLVRLADGGFVVIGEDTQDGVAEGLRFDRDPVDPDARAIRFRFRPPDGFRPTDAARLPDGRLLVLNRRISLMEGIAARLVSVDPAQVRTGAIVEGRAVAAFQPPLTTDNYEAISIAREGGRTIVWIASDDNYSGLQRNLLMKFIWTG